MTNTKTRVDHGAEYIVKSNLYDDRAICVARAYLDLHTRLEAAERVCEAAANDDLRYPPDIYTGTGIVEHTSAWDKLDAALAAWKDRDA